MENAHKSNNLLAKILLKSLESHDPALAEYVKIKPNFYVRYNATKKANDNIDLNCQHLWFFRDNKGTLKVTGKIITKDLEISRKKWVEKCRERNLEGYQPNEDFVNTLCLEPNYQGKNSRDNKCFVFL